MAVFIPFNGGFHKLTDDLKDDSINGITRHLNYKPDQVYCYFGDFDDNNIDNVIVEVFSDTIVFVVTKNDIAQIDNEMVKHFMRNFKIKEAFNAIEVEYLLKNGIESKSLTIDFLSRVLNINDPQENGMIYVPGISMYLYFMNGLLVDFQSSDGLNENARHLKELNFQLYQDYVDYSKKYWGDNLNKVINEVNRQADALFGTPDAVNNKFIPLHKNNCGLCNFFMLMVCHYNWKITFQEFDDVNHGRYEVLIPERKFRLGKFAYEFDIDGNLCKIN